MEALSAIFNSPDPRSQVDIAKRLRIEGPTVTRMIDSLAADGLVERRPAPSDRRTKHLSLTRRGEEVLAEIFAIAEPLRDRLLGELSPERTHELTGWLETLVHRLDNGLRDEAGEER
jgi:MarR family transcriptional regulator for hemolysin